jgi:hypothetical protein
MWLVNRKETMPTEAVKKKVLGKMSNRGLNEIISRTVGKKNGRRMLLDHFSYPAEVSRIGLTEFQVLSKRPRVK